MSGGRPEERPVVAAFDFDGTLTSGGSTWSFLIEMRGLGPVAAATVAVSPRLAAAAVLGGAAADAAKEALFHRTLAGFPADEAATRGAEFGRAHFARHRRADVGARLEQHRRQGHRLVIVSASPELYVDAVGQELGTDAVIATRMAVGSDGLLTGRFDGGNCRDARKLERLREWTAAEAPGALVWAYGNSAGDRHLLAGADVGVDVGRLGRIGRLRAFPRLSDTVELIGR